MSKKIAQYGITELAYWAYPLYLMHTLIIDLTKKIAVNNMVLNIIIIIAINFLIAYLIRKYVEQPFIRVRPKF